MENIQDLVIFFEISSLVLTIIFFKKYKSSFYFYFISYLVFAILADAIGELYRGSNNYWVYNIYTFFEFTSVLGIYYFLSKKQLSKKIIIYISIIFYGIYLLSFKYTSIQNYSVILLHFFILPFLFLYFQQLLYSNKILNYKKELPFWLTVGLLIYYLGTVPFISLMYLGGLRNRILFVVPSMIVLIMHLIFMASLIWSKPTQKL
jgi:hypothetical protein